MTYLPTSHYSCLSTVCIVKMAGWTGYSCCDKILDKSNSRNEGGFFLVLFSHSLCGGKNMRAGMWGSWSHAIHSQEAESNECWFSTQYHLFSPPVDGINYNDGRSPYLNSPSQATPHICVEDFFPIKFMININRHSLLLVNSTLKYITFKP